MWEAISDGRLLAILSIFEGRPSEMASHIDSHPAIHTRPHLADSWFADRSSDRRHASGEARSLRYRGRRARANGPA